MKASTTWSEAPATPTSSSRRRRQRRVALAQRRVASSASADSSASSGASSDQWGPRLDAMRVAGRIEGAQQFGLALKLELEARLRADMQAQFADMLLALDERFDLQLASCRSVFSDTVALVNATFDTIEARLDGPLGPAAPQFQVIPDFPVPAAASPASKPARGGALLTGHVKAAVRRHEARAERKAAELQTAELKAAELKDREVMVTQTVAATAAAMTDGLATVSFASQQVHLEVITGGYTPLFVASQQEHLEVALGLCDAGA